MAETACATNPKTGKLLKSREILMLTQGYLAGSNDGSTGNYITAVRNIVRFAFGGEQNVPKDPTDFNTVLKENVSAYALFMLLKNNIVAVSSLGKALMKKSKHSKNNWAVTPEQMVEFITEKAAAAQEPIDIEKAGNPVVSKTDLEKWLVLKTALEATVIDEGIAKAKAKLQGIEYVAPVDTEEDKDTEEGEAPKKAAKAEKAENPLRVLENTENEISPNDFANVSEELMAYALAAETSVPKIFADFLKIAEKVVTGDEAINSLFFYFKKCEVELGVTFQQMEVEPEAVSPNDDLDDLNDLGDLGDLPM
jgi:hypothetical protein